MEIATSGFQREANTQALADKALSLRPVVLQGYGASNESSASRAGLYQRSGKRLFDLAFSAAFLVLVASWLLPRLGISLGGSAIRDVINATIGAVIVLVIVSFIRRT